MSSSRPVTSLADRVELKRLVFLTGTRADFGKIKSLLRCMNGRPEFETRIFVTGMHMMRKYGYTCDEVEKAGFRNIYKYINQSHGDTMDMVLAKTVSGFSDYVKETQPDMIVVHGDRVEALAGAIVGSLNNILVSHIEGGEVSGTIDELIRHAVSKMSHLHFVANQDAKKRLMQLGERDGSIHVIGSPDLDIMASSDLPSLAEVRRRYDIPFESYAVLLYHPVTTELDSIEQHASNLVEALLRSGKSYVVIYPNNDHGSNSILRAYERFDGNEAFRVFPSMRFEYFLSLMKYSDFVIGNSSAGIREAPFYAIPSIDIGSRQRNRARSSSVLHSGTSLDDILAAMQRLPEAAVSSPHAFGSGNSAEQFVDALSSDAVWNESSQKYFVDLQS